jgi:hypothetical protein
MIIRPMCLPGFGRTHGHHHIDGIILLTDRAAVGAPLAAPFPGQGKPYPYSNINHTHARIIHSPGGAAPTVARGAESSLNAKLECMTY